MFHQPIVLSKNEKTFRYERTPAKTELKVYIPRAAQLSKPALEKLRQTNENYRVDEAKQAASATIVIVLALIAATGIAATVSLTVNMFLVFHIVLWAMCAVTGFTALLGLLAFNDEVRDFRSLAKVGRADTQGVRGYLSDDVRFNDLGITTGMTGNQSQRIKDEIANNSTLGQTLDNLIADHMMNTQVLITALKDPDIPSEKRGELIVRRKAIAEATLVKIREAIASSDAEAKAAQSAKVDAAKGNAQIALDLTDHLVQKEIL